MHFIDARTIDLACKYFEVRSYMHPYTYQRLTKSCSPPPDEVSRDPERLQLLPTQRAARRAHKRGPTARH